MSESRPSVNEPKEGTMTTTFDLDALVLAEGAHDNPDDGMCVMEAVAYIAGEPFSVRSRPRGPHVEGHGVVTNHRAIDGSNDE